MRWRALLIWQLAVLAAMNLKVALSEDEAAGHEVDEEKEADAKEDNSTRPYTAPKTEGLHWVETFDGDAMSRWKYSSQEKYNGKFDIAKRRREGFIGDVALLVSKEAQHYGITSSFPPVTGSKDVPFVIQFEVQFQDGLQCGGSYVKLFDSNGQKAEDFKDDTQFVIMFGPDRCGPTDKVHFILQHKNPISGKWEEKHLKEPPRVPDDMMTHLYGLVIKPDNSFEVQIDGVKKASGDLLTAMEPPINPPKEIDDPQDSKPGDWIDEPKMDDPDSSKPDDWDEDEPYSIPDPAAKIPSGWREDIADAKIADPTSKIPEDWDEDEDGEWEAPTIDNPECTVGCGKWNPPTINNPKYKGKWSAPKIDNPAYKGVWKPRQIANPDFFEDQNPAILPKIDSLGIDIWTMQSGILFDNFVISTDVEKAAAFAEETWRIRSGIEELQKPKPTAGDSIFDMLQRYMVPLGAVGIGLLIVFVWCCCCGSGEVPGPPPRQSNAPSGRDATPPRTEEKKDEPASEGSAKEPAEGSELRERKSAAKSSDDAADPSDDS